MGRGASEAPPEEACLIARHPIPSPSRRSPSSYPYPTRTLKAPAPFPSPKKACPITLYTDLHPARPFAGKTHRQSRQGQAGHRGGEGRGRRVKAAAADALPRNIVRQRQHFVVESTPEFIRVAESPGGAAVNLDGSAGPQTERSSAFSFRRIPRYPPRRAESRARGRSTSSAAGKSSCSAVVSARPAIPFTSGKAGASSSPTITSPARA